NGWVIRVDSLGCLEPGCDSLFTAVDDPPVNNQIGMLLAPNPTVGEVRLSLSDPQAVLLGVRVMNMQGQVVEDMQFLRSATWHGCVLNLGNQAPGVYAVQARTSVGWVVGKVVKE
ncbi:MAG: T9SS type A sorting domain-containing protein, partial [Bacteroidota bacterium]